MVEKFKSCNKFYAHTKKMNEVVAHFSLVNRHRYIDFFLGAQFNFGKNKNAIYELLYRMVGGAFALYRFARVKFTRPQILSVQEKQKKMKEKQRMIRNAVDEFQDFLW